MTEEEVLENLYPTIEWWKPARVWTLYADATKFGCRFCLFHRKREEVFDTIEQWRAHMGSHNANGGT